MQFSQIKEVCLYVQDLDRAEAFYNGKLGLEVLNRVDGRHVFFKAGTSILLCFLSEATRDDEKVPHYGKGKMHIAFEVPREKYEETKLQVRSQGIQIEHEQHWKEDYYSFYFRDPDGHSVEIVPKGMWE